MMTKINKNPLIFVVAVLLITTYFSGCTNEQNNEITLEGDLDSNLFGTWLFSEAVREFTWIIKSDGTFIYNGQNGIWTTNNGKLLMVYENTQTIISLDYSLTNNGSTLNTTDEYSHSMEYTKQ